MNQLKRRVRRSLTSVQAERDNLLTRAREVMPQLLQLAADPIGFRREHGSKTFLAATAATAASLYGLLWIERLQDLSDLLEDDLEPDTEALLTEFSEFRSLISRKEHP